MATTPNFGTDVADGVPNIIYANHIQDLRDAVLEGWMRFYEADFGSTPSGPKRFTVTDADVTTSHSIAVNQDGKTPTGGFGDEAVMDPMIATARCVTEGSFVLDATPLAGIVVGKMRFTYRLG